jgi:hypothetical protein
LATDNPKTAELPPLTDAEKLALCEELEALGMLSRDPTGRRWLTEKSHKVGMALYAFAMLEQAEKDARHWPPGSKH